MKSLQTFLLIICICFSNLLLAQTDDKTEPKNSKEQIVELIEKSRQNIESKQYYGARKDLDDALKIARNLNDDRYRGLVYCKIGNLLLYLEEYDEAELSFQKAILRQELTNKTSELADSYMGLGDTYLKVYKFDSAIKNYKMAQDYYEDANNVESLLTATLKKGIIHYKEDEFSFALEEFDKCIKNAKSKDNLDILSAALIHKGHIEARLIDLGQGSRTAYRGFVIAEENNFTEVLKTSFIIISDIEELNEQSTKANYYLKKHIRFNDSLNAMKSNNLSTKKRLEFLSNDQTEYQIEKIENLEELQNTKAINKATTMLSIALITILSLFTISLYKNNTIRKKSNSELSSKNKELIVAKDKAVQATKAKANFLSTVTHELRTPLYAVTGLTNMLIEENPKKEQIQHLKSLKFSGDYLLTFINDILEVNKIEAQKVEIEYHVFNLKTKIEDIISALKNSQINNSVNIHYEYDKALPEYFKVDQVKISQILINLIGNSIKFTKNGDIWVRVIKMQQNDKKHTLRFEIEDNGIGISDEKQKSIFESFSQGSIAINREYGGTGLGLSIVKGLVGILGGEIKLESILDKGTKFYFDISCLAAEAEEKNTTTSYFADVPKEELAKVNALVVDDNKINQMITKKTLSKLGIKAHSVDNGTLGVEEAKTKKYNVVLMDIHMPGISGHEATKQIRTFDKDLIVFALTAVTIKDKKDEFEHSGFNNIIPKPFKQEVFEKILYTELTKANIIS